MHPSNAWDGTGYFLAVFSPHNSSGGRNYCLMYQKKRKSRCKEAKRIAVAKIYKEESGEGRVQNVVQPLLILGVCSVFLFLGCG